MNKTVLVTGGAGYIGSHFVNLLRKQQGFTIDVADNFSQSRSNTINDPKVTYHEVDMCDKPKLKQLFASVQPDIVVHFAALANVPNSVKDPLGYYENNIVGGLNLLSCMREHGVHRMVFSSSASVYGEPNNQIISENHQKVPTNPYGYTKLVFEQILKDFHKAYGLSSVSFRYFCASGNDESGLIGENHNPETHVIPMLLNTAMGKRDEFFVYGNDFPTPDGTGIRDYVHVNDLAEAHILALGKLFGSATVCQQYNLGINKGFSVLELIKAAERVTGEKIKYSIKERRPGDPSVLIADASSAQQDLGWQPKYTSIEDIIRTAYNYLEKHA